jgi:hypothetical protein
LQVQDGSAGRAIWVSGFENRSHRLSAMKTASAVTANE